MTRLFKGALLLMIAVFLLSACSANIKEEQKATDEKVKTAFNSPSKQTNKTSNGVTFYLPLGYEIEEKLQNNLILNNGSKQYILFYNPEEGPDSEVVYNAAINNNKYQYKKTYKKEGRFGFLLVKELEENLQELTVGIGGVKITTEVKTKNMQKEAESMMDIVKSVKKAEKENKK